MRPLERIQRDLVIEVGTCGGRPIYLRDADTCEHVAIFGKTGSGKSKMVVSCITQIVEQGGGLSLLDADNDTAIEARDRLVEMQAYLSPLRRRKVIYMEPGLDGCFRCDPFERNLTGVRDQAWLATRVETNARIMCAKEQIADLKDFRRMSRILENVGHICGTRVNGKYLGLDHALDVVEFDGPAWDRWFNRVKYGMPVDIVKDCLRIRMLPPSVKLRENESSMNLLRRFLAGPMMKQIVRANAGPSFDWRWLVRSEAVDIWNLARTPELSEEQRDGRQPSVVISFKVQGKRDLDELSHLYGVNLMRFDLVWKPMDRPDGHKVVPLPEYGTARSVKQGKSIELTATNTTTTNREHGEGWLSGEEERSGWEFGRHLSVTNRKERREMHGSSERRTSDEEHVERWAPGVEYPMKRTENARKWTDGFEMSSGTAEAEGTDHQQGQKYAESGGYVAKSGHERKVLHGLAQAFGLTRGESWHTGWEETKSVTMRNHLLPVYREEWYPAGLLYQPEAFIWSMKQVLQRLSKGMFLMLAGDRRTILVERDLGPEPFEGRQVQITEADRAILRLLAQPYTVDMLMEEGLYQNVNSLYRRMGILEAARFIRHVGWVSNGKGNGQLRKVYAVQPWKSDNMEHEIQLTKILRLWAVPFVRGPGDVASELFADAMLLGREAAYVELDRGRKSLNRVEDQLRRYAGRGETVIVIASSESRKSSILDRCAFLGDDLVACTVEEAMHGPGEVRLTYCDGSMTLLKNLLNNLRTVQHAKGTEEQVGFDDAVF
ncbi:MAG: DUF87 domain-containing protein [Planctomycetes bacterium]|nr:DUF87 domain-containing protein [Planctomycetota bacterium]